MKCNLFVVQVTKRKLDYLSLNAQERSKKSQSGIKIYVFRGIMPSRIINSKASLETKYSFGSNIE